MDTPPPRLIMWDIDRTLIHGGGVGVQAYAAAFTAVTGLAWQDVLIAAGRTDRAMTVEILIRHGLADSDELCATLFTRYADEFATRQHLLGTHGRVLPGVREVLAALADRPHVTQTLVTGNIPAVAATKMTAFGLGGPLDVEVGGYGADSPVRATLVARSRQRAEAKYGYAFQPADIVVVGDTVHDIEAALANGVTAVGVATGETAAADLAAAGAHTVLADLGDVDVVVALLAGEVPMPPARSTGVGPLGHAEPTEPVGHS